MACVRLNNYVFLLVLPWSHRAGIDPETAWTCVLLADVYPKKRPIEHGQTLSLTTSV